MKCTKLTGLLHSRMWMFDSNTECVHTLNKLFTTSNISRFVDFKRRWSWADFFSSQDHAISSYEEFKAPKPRKISITFLCQANSLCPSPVKVKQTSEWSGSAFAPFGGGSWHQQSNTHMLTPRNKIVQINKMQINQFSILHQIHFDRKSPRFRQNIKSACKKIHKANR